jgi:hypothetical protein
VNGSETSEEIARNRGRELFLMPRINGRLSAADQIILRPMFQVGHSAGAQQTVASGVDALGARSYGATDTYTSDRFMARLRGDWTRRLEDSRLEVRASGQTAGEDSARQRALAGVSAGNLFTSGIDYSDWRRERELSTSAKLRRRHRHPSVDPGCRMGTALDRRSHVDAVHVVQCARTGGSRPANVRLRCSGAHHPVGPGRMDRPRSVRRSPEGCGWTRSPAEPTATAYTMTSGAPRCSPRCTGASR